MQRRSCNKYIANTIGTAGLTFRHIPRRSWSTTAHQTLPNHSMLVICEVRSLAALSSGYTRPWAIRRWESITLVTGESSMVKGHLKNVWSAQGNSFFLLLLLGLLAVGYEKYGDEHLLQTDPIHHLYQVYVKINQDAQLDPSLHQKANQYFKNMEQGMHRKNERMMTTEFWLFLTPTVYSRWPQGAGAMAEV